MSEGKDELGCPFFPPSAPKSPFLPTPIVDEPARMYEEEEVADPTPRKGPRLKDLTDEDIVLSLLQHPSKLDKFERELFDNCCNIVQHGGILSDKQRARAHRKFELLNLAETFDANNLASVHKVTGAKIAVRTQEELDALMGPKFSSPSAARRR